MTVVFVQESTANDYSISTNVCTTANVCASVRKYLSIFVLFVIMYLSMFLSVCADCKEEFVRVCSHS